MINELTCYFMILLCVFFIASFGGWVLYKNKSYKPKYFVKEHKTDIQHNINGNLINYKSNYLICMIESWGDGPKYLAFKPYKNDLYKVSWSYNIGYATYMKDENSAKKFIMNMEQNPNKFILCDNLRYE